MGENGLFITERLKEMIKRYAKNPDIFFRNGNINEEYIDKLIKEHVEIVPGRRSGKACVRGTRIAIIDIIADTWALGNPREYLLNKMYGGRVSAEAIDAAYAFLMRFHDKVAKDAPGLFFDGALPKDLYS